jgi:hypothetical protein|tara:strand:+ start:256 stop:588 length:333 start_codon:yes stop_codon:yes gene_type:complete
MATKNETYSYSRTLKDEGRSTAEFEAQLSQLSLEEVIGLKLEVASRDLNGKLYGFPIWSSMPMIIKDALIKFANSATKSQIEAARLLGVDPAKYFDLLKNYRDKDFLEKK